MGILSNRRFVKWTFLWLNGLLINPELIEIGIKIWR